jgi:hypothetical protein
MGVPILSRHKNRIRKGEEKSNLFSKDEIESLADVNDAND